MKKQNTYNPQNQTKIWIFCKIHSFGVWQWMYVLLWTIFFVSKNDLSMAQLSPGKLSKAHSHLEGLSNCTKCHAIGDKISAQKCFACHKELESQVTKNKGFHVSVSIKGKECITCHSEHHGENFNAIRWDKKNFNHKQTGYALIGAHQSKVKNCNECHRPENITLVTLKKKTNTFLGLSSKCASCHEDYHQKTLPEDCAKCHNTERFKPATVFNHDQTAYKLNGAHKKVSCESCHTSEVRNNRKFVKYTGISFSNCSSCHVDVHKSAFGTNCKVCHNENSFSQIIPGNSFNHALLGFKLEGKHESISCKKCHTKPEVSYREFKQEKSITCLTCHKDIHEGKLGNDCKSCHNQTSFLLKNKSFVGKFDHDKTNYPLEGKHQTTNCRSCHKTALTDPISHDKCLTCHEDKHNGDFDYKKSNYRDCATCHTTEGFSPSLFSIDKHAETKFKLEGGHLSQPCFSCHLLDKQWKFSKLDVACSSCHSDVHRGAIEPSYYGKNSCATCHVVENWQKINFDHKKTKYILEGKHAEVRCATCHFDTINGQNVQLFKSLSQDCFECHADIHGGQFKRGGVTNCAICHTPKSWRSDKFDHNQTKYKLEGEHQKVACEKCHITYLDKEKKVKSYKIEKYKCIDCHLN